MVSVVASDLKGRGFESTRAQLHKITQAEVTGVVPTNRETAQFVSWGSAVVNSASYSSGKANE
jgi:hypothetical protein